MGARRSRPEYVARWGLAQQARELLIQEQGFSPEEANRYIYEQAQARKLLIEEVAARIVAGEWVWTEQSEVLNPGDEGKWLGCW